MKVRLIDRLLIMQGVIAKYARWDRALLCRAFFMPGTRYLVPTIVLFLEPRK